MLFVKLFGIRRALLGMRSFHARLVLPNKALQPTVLPPLRHGKTAAELGRWCRAARRILDLSPITSRRIRTSNGPRNTGWWTGNGETHEQTRTCRFGSPYRSDHSELCADRSFAVEYLKSALEELDNPDHRAVGLLALRDVAEAYGGLATVAQEAGVTREALYWALSPSGNPTLETLLAVLHAVGMRLSVVPAEPTPVHG